MNRNEKADRSVSSVRVSLGGCGGASGLKSLRTDTLTFVVRRGSMIKENPVSRRTSKIYREGKILW